MIHFASYQFFVGQSIQTALGIGTVEGVRRGTLSVRISGKVINGQFKKKLARISFAPEALRKHIACCWVAFEDCPLDLFDCHQAGTLPPYAEFQQVTIPGERQTDITEFCGGIQIGGAA